MVRYSLKSMSEHSLLAEVLLVVTAILFQTSVGLADDVYIVALRNAAPVATYSGGVSGFARTAAASAGDSIQSDALHVRAYSQFLSRSQATVMADAGLPTTSRIYSYTFVSNAFAAALSPSHLSSLRSHPHVAKIYKSTRHHRLTTRTPSFLGLDTTTWPILGGTSNAGEGVIIGVIDTGIWPEHPAFSDTQFGSYGPPPAKWKGTCLATADFACNNKIIGGYTFRSGFTASHGLPDFSQDYDSPRDSEGHGSHTSSTAAGNNGYTFVNATFGQASGMAPRARIAAYKVFWNFNGTTANFAETADILAAINQAAHDGVDVINFSVDGNPDFTASPSELAFLTATQAGVFSAVAAGNGGAPQFPRSGSIGSAIVHQAPWYTSVAASSHDRQQYETVTLGDQQQFSNPVSTFQPPASTSPLPLIDATAAALPGVLPEDAALCKNNTLDPAKVTGKAVVCKRGEIVLYFKCLFARAAGASGFVLYNNDTVDTIPLQYYPLPAVHLYHAEGLSLLQYIQTDPSPTVAFAAPVTEFIIEAPQMADFSSIGPNDNPYQASLPGRRNDILKPDITAPGVDIRAAFAAYSANPNTAAPGYGLLAGTSMSTPHIAGLAALVKQRFPNFSPFAIKSAMQTTAFTVDSKSKLIQDSNFKPATPFNYGAGHVNARRMMDPGLVYDSSTAEMVGYLRSLNDTAAATFPELYTVATPVVSYNLNLPTISVSRLRGTVTVHRRVTNVASTTSTYASSIVPPANVRVTVIPKRFKIGPGQTVKFKVVLSVQRANENFSFGRLVWRDGVHTVTSVIAVQPVSVHEAPR